MQHNFSLLRWKSFLVWHLLQFMIGGQSLERLDWHESCAEEEQSSNICCCWGSITMSWNIRNILYRDAHIFLMVLPEESKLFF